jgi:hypothetical protein
LLVQNVSRTPYSDEVITHSVRSGMMDSRNMAGMVVTT